jgi:hypothetical protein
VYAVPEERPVSVHEVDAIVPKQPLPLGTGEPFLVTA